MGSVLVGGNSGLLLVNSGLLEISAAGMNIRKPSQVGTAQLP
ncbi:MAG TPA: hypothetical protein VFS77_01565 [Pyrinomonadaceae bacterium]|nr:hypothetical protein [Pyrinomonadaceae bacterium]